MRLYARYEQKGLDRALYYPVNESNHRSRRFAESLGGTGRLMYRVFDKAVGANRPVEVGSHLTDATGFTPDVQAGNR